MLKTIHQNTSAEIVVKKSKFIAHLFYVQSQQEVEEKIKEIQKKYHDAKHHCYAYSIMTERGEVNRISDDGEPSGTAGAPMLHILQKKELNNVLIIVTRYFGGILLGTGGLVKAYTQVSMLALEKADIVKEQLGYVVRAEILYEDFEKFNYYCNKNKINIVKTIYEENIKCDIEVTKEEKRKMFEEKEKINFKINKYEIIKQKNIRKNIEI